MAPAITSAGIGKRRKGSGLLSAIWTLAKGQRVRLQPEGSRHGCRVNPELAPPSAFVAAAMNFTMVSAAERDRELVAHLAAKRSALGKAQVVRVTRDAAANEARLLGHVADVLAVAYAAGLGDGQDAFIDPLRSSHWLDLPLIGAQALTGTSQGVALDPFRAFALCWHNGHRPSCSRHLRRGQVRLFGWGHQLSFLLRHDALLTLSSR
jgi:hypothetical protein